MNFILSVVCALAIMINIIIHIKSKSKTLNLCANYIFVVILCEVATIKYVNAQSWILPGIVIIIGILGYPIFRYLIINYRDKEKDINYTKKEETYITKKKCEISFKIIILCEICLLLICFLLQFIFVEQIVHLLFLEKVLSMLLIMTIIVSLFRSRMNRE